MLEARPRGVYASAHSERPNVMVARRACGPRLSMDSDVRHEWQTTSGRVA